MVLKILGLIWYKDMNAELVTKQSDRLLKVDVDVER